MIASRCECAIRMVPAARRKIFKVLNEQAGRSERLRCRRVAGVQLNDLIHVDDAVAAHVTAKLRLGLPERAALTGSSRSAARVRCRCEIPERYVQLAGLALRIDLGGRVYHLRELMHPWSTEQRFAVASASQRRKGLRTLTSAVQSVRLLSAARE